MQPTGCLRDSACRLRPDEQCICKKNGRWGLAEGPLFTKSKNIMSVWFLGVIYIYIYIYIYFSFHLLIVEPMDLIISILAVVIITVTITKDLPISPRFSPYNFSSRSKFSNSCNSSTNGCILFAHVLTLFSATEEKTQILATRIELTTSALAGVQVTY